MNTKHECPNDQDSVPVAKEEKKPDGQQQDVQETPPFFKCRECGCTGLGVTVEYDRSDYYEASIACPSLVRRVR